MTTPPTYVIVGASLAGARAAETLRLADSDCRIVLVGDEADRPYERPPLSKRVLRGEAPDDDTFVHDEDYYGDNGIELRLGTTVEAVEVSAGSIVVRGGERIGYDRLLIATGAEPRRIRVPGAQLDGIHYLRTLADSRRLRDALRAGAKVAVVGGGWIGSEVAASARQLGVDVCLIDPGPAPLAGPLGTTVGAVFRDLHADHGVDLHLGSTVRGFAGDGRVRGVVLDDDQLVEADVVVVGVGVQPRVELASAAGLALDHGVAVSATLETSAPGVFAAGDVAAAWHPHLERRIRVEHWANAQNQGSLAAHNMVGAHTSYDLLPYFFSDQYELGMEYVGHAGSWDKVVVRGDIASREFIAFWIAADRVVAAMSVNVWDVVEQLQSLIKSRSPVDEALLGDPDTSLDSLREA